MQRQRLRAFVQLLISPATTGLLCCQIKCLLSTALPWYFPPICGLCQCSHAAICSPLPHYPLPTPSLHRTVPWVCASQPPPRYRRHHTAQLAAFRHRPRCCSTEQTVRSRRGGRESTGSTLRHEGGRASVTAGSRGTNLPEPITAHAECTELPRCSCLEQQLHTHSRRLVSPA